LERGRGGFLSWLYGNAFWESYDFRYRGLLWYETVSLNALGPSS
jgi:hypothetical protein